MLINSETVREEKYYQLDLDKRKIDTNLSFDEAKSRLKEILTDSVKLRLDQADVEVGTYFSGGIDSSIITKIAESLKTSESIKTYSIDFEDKLYSEVDFQNDFINQSNISNRRINISYDSIFENIKSAVYYGGQPFYRTAAVPLFLLSQEVNRDKLKVVLCGEGADEVFWGYDIFKEVKIRKYWSQKPDSDSRAELLGSLYQFLPHYNKKYQKFLTAFYKKTLLSNDIDFYSHLVRWQNCIPLKSYFSDDLNQRLSHYDSIEDLRSQLPQNFKHFSYSAKAQYIEMAILLPNILLSSQGDKMAMANSVELRVPFLDTRLVEFASTIPEEYKLKSMQDKYILREAFRYRLPDSIYSRAKQAYHAPEMKSFATNSKDSYVEHLFSNEVTKDIGLFKPGLVNRLYKKAIADSLTGRFSTQDNMAFIQILTTHLFYSFYIKNYL